jgi:putative PIN family toxin of toxin-antitoxin system
VGTKIVLDTNVFVSAFGWKGSPHRILLKCIDKTCLLYISPALVYELIKVLSYKKFNFSPSEIEEFLSIIFETAILVEPAFSLDVIHNDPSDNRILECAVAATCDYIVTGDRHLLEIRTFKGISIITPENFIKFIKGN